MTRIPRLRSAMLVALLAIVSAAITACGDRSSAIPSSTPTRATAATAAGTATIPAPSPTSTAEPADEPTTPPQAIGPSITISAVGDISLARQVVERMEANGAGYPYALITPLLTGDIVVANLEGALTDRGEPWPKGYTFRTPPHFASGLRDAGFDIVSLANNHTLDFGVVGMQDTMAALDVAGVRRVGVGNSDAEAYAPVVIEANGLRVAFLAYAATPTEGGGFAIADWAAGPGAPGMAIGTAESVAAGVRAARGIADFVVVLVHAGAEYVNAPDATQRALAQAALAAGADAYIGAHAHVVQPVEQRGGQLIAWGLGNFIFDLDNVDLANIPVPRVSLVLNLTLTKDAGVTGWEAAPVTLEDAEDRPRPATADEAAVLYDLLR